MKKNMNTISVYINNNVIFLYALFLSFIWILKAMKYVISYQVK